MLYIYNVCFILQLSTAHGDFESRSWRGVHVLNTTLCDILYSVVRIMVFSTTFYNISAISWQSVLLVEETRVPGENH